MFHFVSGENALTPEQEEKITAASAWVQIVPTYAIKPWLNPGVMTSELSFVKDFSRGILQVRSDLDALMLHSETSSNVLDTLVQGLKDAQVAREKLERTIEKETNVRESQILSLASHVSELKNALNEKGILKKELNRLHRAHSVLYYCNICMNKPKAMRFAPCGHMATCAECAEEIMDNNGACPLCRTPVINAERTFVS